MLRIGILLPRSTLFPALGVDILNGLQACISHYETAGNIKLLIDNIGFGVDEAEVYTKAEKMLLQEEADAVLVVADWRIGEMLGPLFAASNKLLVMLHFGANIPESWQQAPTTISHSLNFSLYAGLTGRLAAQETQNKQGVYATSYYDAGYRQCTRIMQSHQASGGQPMFTHVTHLKASEFTLEPLAAFLEQDPDAKTLICLFAGEMATHFYNGILPLQQKHDLQLYVSPMMLESSLADTTGQPLALQHTKGFVPWIPGLENGNNQAFISALKKQNGKTPNYFSLLGWEAGLLLKAALRHQEAGNTNAITIIEALTAQNFDSPRGWLKLDADTHYTFGTGWLVSATGNMDLKAEYEAPDLDTEWRQLTASPSPVGETSGWRNTYLCI